MKWINLYVNSRCNLACAYCYYRDKPQKATISYSLSDLRRVIDQAGEPVVLCFTGGEPTLNPGLMERIAEQCSPVCPLVLQTNGTLLTGLPVALLERFQHIRISIDGDREVMDRCRGKGTYDRAMRNARHVREHTNVPLLARMTLACPDGFAAGFRAISTSGLFDHVYWQLSNDLRGRRADAFFRGYSRDLAEALETWLAHDPPRFFNAIPFVGVYSFIRTEFLRRDGNSYYHCGPGRTMIAIDPDGVIHSCPEGVSRSGRDGGPSDVLGRVTDGRFPQRAHEPKPMCLRCDVRHLCGGRCIWTYDPMFCRATRLLIRLVRTHEAPIGAKIPRSALDGSLQAVNWTEVIP